MSSYIEDLVAKLREMRRQADERVKKESTFKPYQLGQGDESGEESPLNKMFRDFVSRIGEGLAKSDEQRKMLNERNRQMIPGYAQLQDWQEKPLGIPEKYLPPGLKDVTPSQVLETSAFADVGLFPGMPLIAGLRKQAGKKIGEEIASAVPPVKEVGAVTPEGFVPKKGTVVTKTEPVKPIVSEKPLSQVPETPLKTVKAEPPLEPPQPPVKTMLGGMEPPKNIKGAVNEVVLALKQGKSLQPITRQMQSVERGQRAAIAQSYMKNPKLSTAEAMKRAKGAYAGKMGRPSLTPPAVNPETQQLLRDTIRTTPAIPDNFVYTRTTADDALQKIFAGELPTKGEIQLLGEIFGPEMEGALRGQLGLKEKIKDTLLDILNLPRTVKSAFDVSFQLRQGLWVTTRNPKQAANAMKQGLKTFISEKTGLSIDEFYRGNIEKGLAPNADWVRSQEHGLYYAPYKQGQGSLVAREELFTSRLAEKIPGIRMSERSYVTNGNVLRQSLWKKYSTILDKRGAERWEYDELARFINIATGRGEVGQLSSVMPFLSALMFSPRMQAATVELPFMLASKSPAIRRIAAENIGATLGVGVGLLSLAALAGASVEWDPRSADFAKIRVGNTRLDIWGGKQQYVVALARLITGSGKSTTSGKEYEIGPDSFAGDRIALLTHFIRGKLAPGPGLLTDIAVGEDFLGRKMGWDRAGEIAINALAPMSLYQTYESMQQEGALSGALLSVPSYFGVGVSSYDSSPTVKMPTFSSTSSGKSRFTYKDTPSRTGFKSRFTYK